MMWWYDQIEQQIWEKNIKTTGSPQGDSASAILFISYLTIS